MEVREKYTEMQKWAQETSKFNESHCHWFYQSFQCTFYHSWKEVVLNNSAANRCSLITDFRESEYFDTKLAFLWLCLVTVFLCTFVSNVWLWPIWIFYFSWFWNRTWHIPSYTLFLSFHSPHFCTKHWHSGVWRKPAGRKGSVASCGGAEAWQFLGWKSNERPCSFLFPSTGCPPTELEVWAYEGSTMGLCACGGGGGGTILPSQTLPSTTLQQQ